MTESGWLWKAVRVRDRDGASRGRTDTFKGPRATALIGLIACIGALTTTSHTFGQTSAPQTDLLVAIDNSYQMRAFGRASALRNAIGTAMTGVSPQARVAFVQFGKRPQLNATFASREDPRFDVYVTEALRRIALTNRRSDLAAAVERGLSEFREHSDPSSVRALVIITNAGTLGNWETRRATNWVSSTLAPEAIALRVRISLIVLGDRASFEMPQRLAWTTNGTYMRASTLGSVPGLLDRIVRDQVNARPETSEAMPIAAAVGAARELPSFLPLATFAVVIACAVLSALNLRRLRLERGSHAADRAPTFEPAPRADGETGDVALPAAESALDTIQHRLEFLVATTEAADLNAYQDQEELENRLTTLCTDCVLVMDHLEGMITGRTLPQETIEALERIQRRFARLLASARIEEINVEPGSLFDAGSQIAVSARDADAPPGTILSVQRKGYAIERRRKGKVVLRPAEVIVARHRAEAAFQNPRV